MITQQKAELQALSPKTWNQPTTHAHVGDYIREPFMPIIVVVDKDLLPDGRVWLLVKPVSGFCTQEWILDPPTQPPEQQQPQQEPTEPTPAVGYAGDTVCVDLRPTYKAYATMAEWEEAAALIPPGYRIKNGLFYDSY